MFDIQLWKSGIVIQENVKNIVILLGELFLNKKLGDN